VPAFVKRCLKTPVCVHGAEKPTGPPTTVTSCWNWPLNRQVNVVNNGAQKYFDVVDGYAPIALPPVGAHKVIVVGQRRASRATHSTVSIEGAGQRRRRSGEIETSCTIRHKSCILILWC